MVNPLRRFWDYLAVKFSGYPISRYSETPGVLFSSQTSSAGVEVTEETALSLSAVFAGVNLLSRVLGSLPLHVYQRDGRRKEIAHEHPAYRLLHTQPNPEMTAVSFRRALEWNRLLYGGAYAEIQWAGSGQPAALWPLEGWRVSPDRDQQQRLHYKVAGAYGEPERVLGPEDVIAVPHVSCDGVCGRGVVHYAVQSLGLAIGVQEFAARYFGNSATPGGYLCHPGSPSPEARREFQRAWNEFHQGASNAHKTAVVYGGWEHKPGGGHDAEKAQLLEQRRFGNEEVARWLNIPPHLLRDLTRATFSNIEHQGIDFVIYSLGPTLAEYEQEYDRKLLDPPSLYSKHNVAGLMRGDHAARASFYTQMFQIGVFNVNECRELEDMNPVEGGDTHLLPLNMAPLADVVSGKALEAKAAPAGQGAGAPKPKAALASDHWKSQPRDDEGQWDDGDGDADGEGREADREREDAEHDERTEGEAAALDRRQARERREIAARWRAEDREWAQRRKADREQDARWSAEDEAVARRRSGQDDEAHARRFDEDLEAARRAQAGEPEEEHPGDRDYRRRREDRALAAARKAEDRDRRAGRAEEKRARQARRAERADLLGRRERDDVERQRRHLREQREMHARWRTEDRHMRDRWAREDEARGASGLSAAPPPGPAPGMRKLLESTLARLARVEGNALRRAAEQPAKFLDAVERLYVKHEATLAEAVAPTLAACRAVGVEPTNTAEEVAAAWCRWSRTDLLELAGGVTAAGLSAAVAEYLTDLENGRPARNAGTLIEEPAPCH
jgi:HK97 family phage portal protein